LRRQTLGKYSRSISQVVLLQEKGTDDAKARRAATPDSNFNSNRSYCYSLLSNYQTKPKLFDFCQKGNHSFRKKILTYVSCKSGRCLVLLKEALPEKQKYDVAALLFWADPAYTFQPDLIRRNLTFVSLLS